jgi:hypothetical protein
MHPTSTQTAAHLGAGSLLLGLHERRVLTNLLEERGVHRDQVGCRPGSERRSSTRIHQFDNNRDGRTTFSGPATQELLHSATVAIAGSVTLDDLWHAVPSFPTVSEVWLRLLENYGL